MKPKKHIHGFDVPEEYFDTLEERIMQNIAMENLPEETGMQVPENYFEQVTSRILAKTSSSKNKKVKTIRLNPWRTVAATAAILVLGMWLLAEKNELQPSKPNLVHTEYSLEHYMEELVSDMSDASLYNLIEDKDLVQKQASFNEYINIEEVEAYLLENMDLSTLLTYE